MKLANLVAAVAALLLLGACGGGEEGGADPAALVGTPWVLTAGPGSPEPGQGTPSLEFDGQRIAGSGGCNGFSAAYEADGSELTVDEIASTLIHCPGDEEGFFAALETVGEWELRDGELVLSGGDGGPLRFAAPTP